MYENKDIYRHTWILGPLLEQPHNYSLSVATAYIKCFMCIIKQIKLCTIKKFAIKIYITKWLHEYYITNNNAIHLQSI